MSGADPEDASLAQVSLNGAQIASLLELLKSVAKGELPRESGLNMIMTAFPIGRTEAEAILGQIGKSFKTVEQNPGTDDGAQ